MLAVTSLLRRAYAQQDINDWVVFGGGVHTTMARKISRLRRNMQLDQATTQLFIELCTEYDLCLDAFWRKEHEHYATQQAERSKQEEHGEPEETPHTHEDEDERDEIIPHVFWEKDIHKKKRVRKSALQALKVSLERDDTIDFSLIFYGTMPYECHECLLVVKKQEESQRKNYSTPICSDSTLLSPSVHC